MKLRCAIVDDEPLALDLMESYVKKTPFLELINKYASAITAMNGIKEEPVDLLFLDIQMPDLSGIEFSKMVDADTRIIFTTAFSQYAVEGFRSNALDYLLKPISYKDFVDAANKALRWFELAKAQAEASPASATEKEYIYVKSEYKLIKIDLKDILYIEGLKDYVKIYVEGQNRAILSLMSMKSLEDYLPSPQFLRVHRSYIIQMSKIELIDKGRIIFGRTQVPISESNKETVQRYINEHSI